MPLHTYSRANLRMIVSRHADGEIVTQVGRYFRLRTVRGSSRRGGVEAARQILRHGRDWHLAVTPDGPRGPRRQFQPGAAYLASRTGRPLVPCGIGYERPWRLKSWDRFAVPRPWSDIVLVLGHPIRVPEDAGRGELEHYRLLAEREMHRLTEVAEAWAETGKFRPLWNAVARAG